MILHLLAVAGLFGYGLATGRFDEDKRQQYLATWNGEKLVPYVEEVVEDKAEESPQDATIRIYERQLNQEVVSLELQRQLELMRDMKFTLEEAHSKLEKDRTALDKKENEFDDKLQLQQDKAAEEGFLKALQSYSQLNPKYVKNDFMVMDEKEVVRYLAAMDSGVRTEVLGKFRTPEEEAKRVRLVRMLKDHGIIDVE